MYFCMLSVHFKGGKGKMKKLIAIAASFVVMTASTAFAAPEYVIKVGSIVSETHADMLAMNKVFKPQVEKL